MSLITSQALYTSLKDVMTEAEGFQGILDSLRPLENLLIKGEEGKKIRESGCRLWNISSGFFGAMDQKRAVKITAFALSLMTFSFTFETEEVKNDPPFCM